MKDFLITLISFGLAIVIIPIIVYFSVKCGTVGYYKAKRFIEKKERKL